MVTLLDVSAVAGHHAMPAALLFDSVIKGVISNLIIYFNCRYNSQYLENCLSQDSDIWLTSWDQCLDNLINF